MDIFLTPASVFPSLRQLGIGAVGTSRPKLKIASDGTFNSEYYLFVVFGTFCWFDNGITTMVCSFHEPTEKC